MLIKKLFVLIFSLSTVIGGDVPQETTSFGHLSFGFEDYA